MLDILISIIFVILSLSLFATTLMEMISSILSLRGQHLMRGIKRMLAGAAEHDLFAKFEDNSLFKQLESRFLRQKRPPSYLSAKTFSLILWNILTNNEPAAAREKLEERAKGSALVSSLQQLFDQAEISKLEFEEKITTWYDEVMERVTGWYKRNTQFILLLLGISISIAFDADIVSIYHQLSNNPEKQLELLAKTERYLNQAEKQTGSNTAPAFEGYEKQMILQLVSSQQTLKEPLGLGWYQETKPKTGWEWMMKVLGWLITAMGISLGAPFWFDLLKKLMNIKNSGGLSSLNPQKNSAEKISERFAPRVTTANTTQELNPKIEAHG